jgi:hypothetical protein
VALAPYALAALLITGVVILLALHDLNGEAGAGLLGALIGGQGAALAGRLLTGRDN